MNLNCLLLFVLSSVGLFVFCDETQLKNNNARRNKYQKSQQVIVLPVNGSQPTALAAIIPLQTATNAESLSTSAIVKSSETNKTLNSNDISDEPKLFVSNSNPDENLISNNNATETSRKSSKPLRNNQALFEALKKRRKEAYQRKINKKSQITSKKDASDVNFENQAKSGVNKNNTAGILPEIDSNQSQKPTKKSSTYRNKSKNFGQDGHGFNKSKTRRFSVKV